MKDVNQPTLSEAQLGFLQQFLITEFVRIQGIEGWGEGKVTLKTIMEGEQKYQYCAFVLSVINQLVFEKVKVGDQSAKDYLIEEFYNHHKAGV